MLHKRPRLCCGGNSAFYETAPISVSDLELSTVSNDVYQLIDFLNENKLDPSSYLLRPEVMRALDADAYWMLHINGVLDFGHFVCSAPAKVLASYICNSLLLSSFDVESGSDLNTGSESVCCAVAGEIVKYLWEHCCQRPMNGTSLIDTDTDKEPDKGLLLAQQSMSVLNYIADRYIFSSSLSLTTMVSAETGDVASVDIDICGAKAISTTSDGRLDVTVNDDQFSLFHRICALGAATSIFLNRNGDLKTGADTSTGANWSNSNSGITEAVLEWEVRQLCILGECVGCPALLSRRRTTSLIAVLHPRAMITALDKTLRHRVHCDKTSTQGKYLSGSGRSRLDSLVARACSHQSESHTGGAGDVGMVALLGAALSMEKGLNVARSIPITGSGGHSLQKEIWALCQRVCRLGLEELQSSSDSDAERTFARGTGLSSDTGSLSCLCERSINCVILLQQWSFTCTDTMEQRSSVSSSSSLLLADALEPFIYDMLLDAINISYSSSSGSNSMNDNSTGHHATNASLTSRGNSCFSLLLSVVLQRIINELAQAPSVAAEASLQQIYRAVRALKRDLQESEASTPPVTKEVSATVAGKQKAILGNNTRTTTNNNTAAASSSAPHSVSVSGTGGGFAAVVSVPVLHAFWTIDRKPHRAAINQTLLSLKAVLDGPFDVQRTNALTVVPVLKTGLTGLETRTDKSDSKRAVAAAVPVTAASVLSMPPLPSDITREKLLQWHSTLISTGMLSSSISQYYDKFCCIKVATGAPSIDPELYVVSCFRRHIAASSTTQMQKLCYEIAVAMRKHLTAGFGARTEVNCGAAVRSLDSFITMCNSKAAAVSNSAVSQTVVASATPELLPGVNTDDIEAAVDSQYMKLLEKTVSCSGLTMNPHVIRCYKELCVIAVCFSRRATVAAPMLVCAVPTSAASAPVLGYTCTGTCLLTHLQSSVKDNFYTTDSANVKTGTGRKEQGSLSNGQTEGYVFSRIAYCFKQLLVCGKRASTNTAADARGCGVSATAAIGAVDNDFGRSMCNVFFMLVVQLVDQVLMSLQCLSGWYANSDASHIYQQNEGSQILSLSPLYVRHHYRAYWFGILTQLIQLWTQGCEDCAAPLTGFAPFVEGSINECSSVHGASVPPSIAVIAHVLRHFVADGKLKLLLHAKTHAGLGDSVSREIDLFNSSVRFVYPLEAVLTIAAAASSVLGVSRVAGAMPSASASSSSSMLSLLGVIFYPSMRGRTGEDWNLDAAVRLFVVLRSLLLCMPDSSSDSASSNGDANNITGNGGLTDDNGRQQVMWHYKFLHRHLSSVVVGCYQRNTGRVYSKASCSRAEIRSLLRDGTSRECLRASTDSLQALTQIPVPISSLVESFPAATSDIAALFNGYSRGTACWTETGQDGGVQTVLSQEVSQWVEQWIVLQAHSSAAKTFRSTGTGSTGSGAVKEVSDFLRTADTLFTKLMQWIPVACDSQTTVGITSCRLTAILSTICSSYFHLALQFAGLSRQKQLLEHWCSRGLCWLSDTSSDSAHRRARTVMGRALYFTCLHTLEQCHSANSNSQPYGLLREGASSWSMMLYEVLCLVHPISTGGGVGGCICANGSEEIPHNDSDNNDSDCDSDNGDIAGRMFDISPPALHLLPTVTQDLGPVQEAIMWWRDCLCNNDRGTALTTMGVKLSTRTPILSVPRSALDRTHVTGSTTSICLPPLNLFKNYCHIACHVSTSAVLSRLTTAAADHYFVAISELVFDSSGNTSTSSSASTSRGISDGAAVIDQLLACSVVSMLPPEGAPARSQYHACLARMAVYCYFLVSEVNIYQPQQQQQQQRHWSVLMIAVILRHALTNDGSVSQMDAFASSCVQLCMHMIVCCTFWLTFRGCNTSGVNSGNIVGMDLCVALHRVLLNLVCLKGMNNSSGSNTVNSLYSSSDCVTMQDYPNRARNAFRSLLMSAPHPPSASVSAALLTRLEKEAVKAHQAVTIATQSCRSQHTHVGLKESGLPLSISPSPLRNVTNLPAYKTTSNLGADVIKTSQQGGHYFSSSLRNSSSGTGK